MLIGRPDEIADRLRALFTRFPLDELVFWARLPGVPHEMARDHLVRLAETVIPAIRAPSVRDAP